MPLSIKSFFSKKYPAKLCSPSLFPLAHNKIAHMRTVPDFSSLLQACRLCPRQCGIDRRQGATGFCRVGLQGAIASVTPHHGEEPVLSGSKGICNVFFSHCNLSCLFCQNHQISRNTSDLARCLDLPQAIQAIAGILDQGIHHLGFVSPSHMVPQMLTIIDALRKLGFRPVVVYNSNGYDQVSTLRLLEDWVDVYLPDCKYMDARLAQEYSGAADYPEKAGQALVEMYRQKGSLLHLDKEGMAERGMIVRHLVLPGAVENSLKVLRFLATSLSGRIHLSLMAQYYPAARAMQSKTLGRRITAKEYEAVVTEAERLGFCNGWIQDHDSADFYCPDFGQDRPFTPKDSA